MGKIWVKCALATKPAEVAHATSNVEQMHPSAAPAGALNNLYPLNIMQYM